MDTIQADGREEIFLEEGLPLSTIPDPPLCTYKCHNLTKFFLHSAQPCCPGQTLTFLKLESQKSWLEGTSADHQFSSLLEEGLHQC